MKKQKLKLNRAVNFRTNEDLYYEFALKCKSNKQKIGDRINTLIAADVVASTPVYTVTEEPVLFDVPNSSSITEDPADASAEN